MFCSGDTTDTNIKLDDINKMTQQIVERMRVFNELNVYF